MPVFHALKAVFVHIPKNAGRSIEQALLGETGTPDDGRRSTVNRAATWLQRRSADPFVREHLIGTLDYTLAAQHLTWLEMAHLRLLPEAVLTGYESFCVCRNPFDRAVSTVLHFAKTDGAEPPKRPEEFERALDTWLDREKSDHNLIAHDRSQADFVLDARGQMAVKRVLRFERLGEDFAALAKDLGAPTLSLGTVGAATRHRTYQDYYTPLARERVEKKFGEDLELFGYRFAGGES